MNRKLLNGLLVLTVAAGGVGTFTSCKDENFGNEVNLKVSSLEAQLAAIREVTDIEFQNKLQEWIDSMTDTYSDAGFENYYELCQAAKAMYQVYQDIMNNNITGDTEKYVKNLYDWMYHNEIVGSDWYELIYAVADRVGNVEVSQTYNPVFGSVNLPVGLNTTMLASYMVSGANANGAIFPTDMLNDQYLAEASPWHPDENDMIASTIQSLIGANGHAVTAGDYTCVEGLSVGNLGAAYVNVNPLSADVTTDKYTLSLVNSVGEELEGVTLTPTYNEDVLSFGYTREGNSGIYKVKVDADENFAGVSVDLYEDALSFKDDVVAFVRDKKITNLAYIGEELYKKLNNLLPAYGVKVSWEENQGEPHDDATRASIENSVVSSLDLAVASIHPLSYGLPLSDALGEAGLKGKKLPVWNSLDEILDKIDNKLTLSYDDIEGLDQIDINLNIKIENNTITYTWINENGEEQEEYEYVYTEGFGVDADQEKYLAQFVEAIVTALNQEINGSLNHKIIDDLNASIQNINDQLAKYNSKVGSFFDYIKGRKEYNYAEKLYDYYAKVAQVVNRILADPSHYLQVAALYSDVEGHYHHLSTRPGYGATTVVTTGDPDDAIELLCASYTGDVVVPSYLKYVAITEVDGQPATAADNAKGGEALNTVFPGQEIRVPVKVADFAGHTLTISYISVDYSGVCSMQNYYVNVK